jgi:uncharacterized membrane protein (Fun14 family)
LLFIARKILQQVQKILADGKLKLSQSPPQRKFVIMSTQAVDAASSTDIFSSIFLIGNVGAPFVIGLAVGYFAKKMLRTALFLGGAVIVLLFVAEYYDIIDITDEKLQHAATAATEAAKSSGGFLVDRLTRVTSKGVSGVGGFFVGLKLG